MKNKPTSDDVMHIPIAELEGIPVPSLNPHRVQKVVEVSDLAHSVLVISEGTGRNMVCSNHAYKHLETPS